MVVGNPPYIRQEWLTADQAVLGERFPQLYHGMADLYVYFYELGLDLLRRRGRLAFVSSSAFARSSYAERLRGHLCPCLEQFVDLGDTQVFEDAKDVYPAIVVLSKGAEHQPSNIATSERFDCGVTTMPRESASLLIRRVGMCRHPGCSPKDGNSTPRQSCLSGRSCMPTVAP